MAKAGPLQIFAKAVELDPNYGRAYAGLADCDSFLYLMYRVEVPIDGLLATTAKALDDTLAEAHASRGLALSAAHRREEARGGPELANWAKHDSDLDGLRSHPRFQKILEQIG